MEIGKAYKILNHRISHNADDARFIGTLVKIFPAFTRVSSADMMNIFNLNPLDKAAYPSQYERYAFFNGEYYQVYSNLVQFEFIEAQ